VRKFEKYEAGSTNHQAKHEFPQEISLFARHPGFRRDDESLG
jgi:hypothetical protein